MTFSNKTSLTSTSLQEGGPGDAPPSIGQRGGEGRVEEDELAYVPTTGEVPSMLLPDCLPELLGGEGGGGKEGSFFFSFFLFLLFFFLFFSTSFSFFSLFFFSSFSILFFSLFFSSH